MILAGSGEHLGMGTLREFMLMTAHQSVHVPAFYDALVSTFPHAVRRSAEAGEFLTEFLRPTVYLGDDLNFMDVWEPNQITASKQRNESPRWPNIYADCFTTLSKGRNLHNLMNGRKIGQDRPL